LSALPNEKPKESVPNGSVDSKKLNSKSKGSSGGKKEAVDTSFEVLEKMSGASLVGMK
jgi:isoleucyl-tRNA synthetase